MDKIDKLAIVFLISISLIAGGLVTVFGHHPLPILDPPKQEQVKKPVKTLQYRHELYSCVKK